MNFELLVNTIQATHNQLQQSAIRSVNIHLTIRNWLIGFYIVEFEQNGSDRATYGERLFAELAKTLNVKGLAETNLKLSRQFYLVYPQIAQIVSEQLQQIGFSSIRHLSTDELQIHDNQTVKIRQTASDEFISTLPEGLQVPPNQLINSLSFSHFVLLLPIEDPLKRTFYEIECMKGTWSVSELKRQINSLYFERSGMSTNPEKLSRLVNDKAHALVPTDIIKSPFTFEFLGLKAKDVVYESDLEQALIDHLEEFY